MAKPLPLVRHPIVQAPMAGGAGGPELAAAVSEAGGLGFLAAGYKSAAAMRDEIAALRKLTGGSFGVNLFMPQPASFDPTAVAAYAERLAPEAAGYGTTLGYPDRGTDDDYQAKLAALVEDPVPVVSFTFGCPEPGDLGALRRVGSATVVTVTSVAEARAAESAGVDAICVQGIEAGGHQGTHRDEPALGAPESEGAGVGLLTLVALVREAVSVPLIAAGGLMRGSQLAAALALGAEAGQLGTAFLPCPESGANALHKAALTDPAFPHTELTRAFSGRPARGLVNRFAREHGREAPAAYPRVHHLTAPLRKAAVAAGDPQAMALWAGQGHRLARTLPAGELVETLAEELRLARRALDR